jgi:ABC-type bacteriocin/lantibiotic exporter with double-glycine peptidase domain
MISVLTSATNAFFKTQRDVHNRAVNPPANFFKRVVSSLTRKEKSAFCLLILSDIVISVVDVLSLALLLGIIQFYIQPGKNNFISFLPTWMLDRNSIFLASIFFFVFAIKNVIAFFITKAQYKFIGGVAVRISANSLVNYQQGRYEDFVNIDSSVYVRKIAHQPFEFAQYILSGIQQIMTQSFLILVAVSAILLFDAKLFFLLLLLLLPPVIIVFYFIKRKLSHYRTKIWSSNDQSYQYLMDALKGYVESNIYNRNQFFLNRFLHQRKKFSNYHFDFISLQTLPSRSIEIFAVLGLVILIALAKWTGSGDNAFLTIGAFMAAAYKIIPGIVKIINTMGQIKAYELSIDGLDKNLKSEENFIARKNIESIELKNVSFEYSDRSVLKNFSVHLQRGDFVVITGGSGRGKTTLLNLLLGLLQPCTGEVLVNGSVVNAKAIKDFWPSISYVRQQTFLIHDSLQTNITLEETVDAISLQSAIGVSGINNLVCKSPGGVNKIITENGKNISGGQQQRIAIARAIYNDADLIILDEPFNELDEASEHALLNHFKQLAQTGKIIILVTHNLSSLDYCNKIVSLDEEC